MPFLQIKTNVAVPEARQKELLALLSRSVVDAVGKPEQYVMVAIQPAAMRMSGKEGDAAFVEVRSIGGLNALVNKKLSQRVCTDLKHVLGISPERIYINFVDVDAGSWGWNGETFG